MAGLVLQPLPSSRAGLCPPYTRRSAHQLAHGAVEAGERERIHALEPDCAHLLGLEVALFLSHPAISRYGKAPMLLPQSVGHLGSQPPRKPQMRYQVLDAGFAAAEENTRRKARSAHWQRLTTPGDIIKAIININEKPRAKLTR